MMNQVCCFDIDGTLADIEHRRHFVTQKPKRWDLFFKGIPDDTPRDTVVQMLKNFHAAGYRIVLCSGRSEDQRKDTVAWLFDVAGVGPLVSNLYMRASKDNRPDELVKAELYDQMIVDGFDDVVCVVDDRPKVIRMWRARGLFVIDVGDGVEF